MTSDVALLVNPVAGRGKGAEGARATAAVLRDAGFTVRTLGGADADDALRLARAVVAEGTGGLIAVGGDGMASLALQAVAGTDTPLGVVAVGTGNDFARATGLPVLDPIAAGRLIADALTQQRCRPLDLGRAGERWFGSVLASGLDSRVNDRGNRMRWPSGKLRYDLALLAEVATLRAFDYRLTLDDAAPFDARAILVAVGNGPSYGGGMRICAAASMTDGLLDVAVVAECSRTELLRVFPRVYRGSHLGHPLVTVHRARSVTLCAPGVTAYADGEPLGPLPVTVTSQPAAVRLLASA